MPSRYLALAGTPVQYSSSYYYYYYYYYYYAGGCRHLDADEAIVRGAAWYAANLSTTFRLNKKFGMSDGAPYPIVFQVSAQPPPHN